MNITVQAENVICIELTCDDMKRLDITYEKLDYANIETRRILWTLLDEAKQCLGRDIRLTQKMLIEVIPDEGGGCSLYFTVDDSGCHGNSRKKLLKYSGMKIVCQATDIENIGRLAEILHKSEKISKSELYTDGEKYRLVISPKATACADMAMIAGEFCEICDSFSVNHTAEHWKLLASPDAVGIMSALG